LYADVWVALLCTVAAPDTEIRQNNWQTKRMSLNIIFYSSIFYQSCTSIKNYLFLLGCVICGIISNKQEIKYMIVADDVKLLRDGIRKELATDSVRRAMREQADDYASAVVAT